MSVDTQAIRDAPPPFASKHDSQMFSYPADFILRSGDGFDFHVHREMLKLISDCFEGMFVVAGDKEGQEGDLNRDGKPIVSLTEPKHVLYKLFTLAYPVLTLSPFTLTRESDLNDITAIFEAARKYQFIRVPRLLEHMLNKSALIKVNPHRMFAIARVCGFSELARQAALATLSANADALNITFPETKLLTWDDAHKMNQFHKLCCTASTECAKSMGKIQLKSDPALALSTLNRLTNPQTDADYVWWTEKGHAYDCGIQPPPLTLSDRAANLKRRASIFNRGPAAPEILEPRASWFRGYIERVQERLAVVPTDVAIPLSSEERRIVTGCRLCANRADIDVVGLQFALAELLGYEHGRIGECFGLIT
ncbi:BTB domain-containing protein [Mycena kentingensis (nom. inval.)]|nr:BTB domain-containing protein [Mycena kentingensis (nom. inval.)]